MSSSDDKEWYSIYWKIKDFSLQAVENNHHSLRSPAFRTPLTGSNALLELELLTRNGNDRELIVRVQRSGGERIASLFQCELSFLAANRTVLRNFQVENPGRCTSNPSIYHEFYYPQSEILGRDKHLFLPQNTLTLCCRIPLYGMPSGQCFTHTVFHSLDFHWRIPHFTCTQPILTKIIQLASHKFVISLFKGISSSEKKAVDIQVSQTHGNRQSFVSYNFSIIDEKRKELSRFHFNDFISSESGHCKRIRIVLESKFLTNNTLFMQWVFNVGVGEILHEDMPPLSDPLALQFGNKGFQTHFNSTWRDDFQRMYKDQLYCDLTLRTGKTSFSTHKIVLCNRSSVFRDLIMNGKLNNQSDIIDIPDIEPTIVDQMLLYIYTNSLPIIHSDEVAKMYYAADKYALLHLKVHCVSIMFEELCLSNVCSVLELAFSHQDEALLACVMDYILKNNEVISSMEWKDLEVNKPWLPIKLFRMLHFKSKGQSSAT